MRQANQQQMQPGGGPGAMTPQNKVFQLNKQLILTCRKLETGPLENYTHMATLIHKVNLLLLEYDSIAQMRNIVNIVFSDKLLNTIIDFCMNTESFSNFGIRLIEILSLEFPHKIAKSEVFAVVQGLLRTNDYEVVAQCLSFVSVMAQQISVVKQTEQLVGKTKHEPLVLENIISPRIVLLVLTTVSKQPDHAQIEFVHYSLEIVGTCILNAQLREVILTTNLPGLTNMKDFQGKSKIAKSEKEAEPTAANNDGGQGTAQSSTQAPSSQSKGGSDSAGQNNNTQPPAAGAGNTSATQPGDSQDGEPDGDASKEVWCTYLEFLEYLEKQDQFKSVPKLCQRIARQRKELEMWRRSQELDQQRSKQKQREQEEAEAQLANENSQAPTAQQEQSTAEQSAQNEEAEQKPAGAGESKE